MSANEIHHYVPYCEKMKSYLQEYIPPHHTIAYSCNKVLKQMLEELKLKLGGTTCFDEEYIPNLKLDMLFGIKNDRTDEIKLCLIEGKAKKSLTLMDYSQLLGYMQVAKKIKVGLLSLFVTEANTDTLSNDFHEIIDMKYLPMHWRLSVKASDVDEEFNFKVGICSYVPKNGIDWIPSDKCNGIANWDSLVKVICDS